MGRGDASGLRGRGRVTGQRRRLGVIGLVLAGGMVGGCAAREPADRGAVPVRSTQPAPAPAPAPSSDALAEAESTNDDGPLNMPPPAGCEAGETPAPPIARRSVSGYRGAAVELHADGLHLRAAGGDELCVLVAEANLTPDAGTERIFHCGMSEEGARVVAVLSADEVLMARGAPDEAGQVLRAEPMAFVAEREGEPVHELVLHHRDASEAGTTYLSWAGYSFRPLLEVPTRRQVDGQEQEFAVEVSGAPGEPTVTIQEAGERPMRYRWSAAEGRFTAGAGGIRAGLFRLVALAEGEWVAAPLACVGGHRWIDSSTECLNRLPPRPWLRTRRGQRLETRGVVRDPQHGHRGFRVRASRGGYVVFSRSRLWPERRCQIELAGDERGAVPIAPASLERSALLRTEAGQALRTALADGHFTLDEALQTDFDGDGRADRWATFELERSHPMRHDVAGMVARFGDRDAWELIELTSTAEAFTDVEIESNHRLGDSLIALHATDCMDLDGERNVELVLGYGGDTERHYEYVQLVDGQLRPVGYSLGFGD